ncbi:hypothetical protein PV325_011010 [Microctonus aethiopoides]|nr:hypothetical protein PV325_011010 [Microctonus aethiopoides]
MITPEEARENLGELIARRSLERTVIDTLEIDPDKTIIFEELPPQATDDNKYGLYPDLVDKMKDFPLWTNVCTPKTMSRPSSCYVETNFEDLKMNLRLGKSETATDYYWASDYVNVSNKVEQYDSVSISKNHVNFASNTNLAESKSDQNDSFITFEKHDNHNYSASFKEKNKNINTTITNEQINISFDTQEYHQTAA